LLSLDCLSLNLLSLDQFRWRSIRNDRISFNAAVTTNYRGFISGYRRIRLANFVGRLNGDLSF
jgi:hypothetical protein